MPSTRSHIFDRWRQMRAGARAVPPERDPQSLERNSNTNGFADAAQKWGYALTEMLTGMRPEFEKRAMRDYYQNPADPSQIWGGSGQKPEWVNRWEADGRSLEELRVRRPPH